MATMAASGPCPGARSSTERREKDSRPPSRFVAVRAFVTGKTAPAKLPLVSPVVLVWLVIVVLQTLGIR